MRAKVTGDGEEVMLSGVGCLWLHRPLKFKATLRVLIADPKELHGFAGDRLCRGGNVLRGRLPVAS